MINTTQKFAFVNIGSLSQRKQDNICPKRDVEIVIIFKIQNIKVSKIKTIQFKYFPPGLLQAMVAQMEMENIQKISLNRPIMKFVKNDRQFISFQKLKHQSYKFLLERDVIQIQYLYRNKRDQVAKKINRFQNQVIEKHAYLMQISKDQRSKIDLLKRLASKKSGLQSDTSLQIKIKITLLISDPLVKNKNIPVGHQEIDIEEHIKVLKQASNSQKSLLIAVNKSYATENNINSIFTQQIPSYHNKTIKIVHFFTRIVKKNSDLFIVFEDRGNGIGEQKLINAKDFFQKIKKSSISLLIIIGHNVNLLNEQIKQKSLEFSILLLSTYSPNTEEGFLYFIKSFYQQVFNRNQISYSLSIAQEEYKKNFIENETWKNNLVCCCLHEHKETCAWCKIVQKTGVKLAHKIFFHKNLRGTNLKSTNVKLQAAILDLLNLETEQCTTLEQTCCQQSHAKKSNIMENKIIAFPSMNSEQNFKVSESLREFVKNQFQVKMTHEKISPARRCPLIIFQIVKKILSNNGKIIEMSSRRVGKSHFIQAACKYIQSRKYDYDFEHIDLNEGSLQQCVKYMYSKTQKNKHKKMVFIHQNSGALIQKQYLRHFKQSKNLNAPFLPFTFIIKTQQQQNATNSIQQIQSGNNNLSFIKIPKLSNFDIFCQVYYELRDEYLQQNKNLSQILSFCNIQANKNTYRNIRNFLKHFNQKQPLSKISKGKTLQQVYKDMTIDFIKKMQQIKTTNKNLYDFLGFISQFPQGIYLTKLNALLLKQIFGIDDLKAIMKNKQNINYYFEVIQKINAFKAVNIKSQKIDFVLPQDKIINYFKHQGLQLHQHLHQMKFTYFNYFFTLLQTLILQNITIVGNRLKKQRVFLDEGIFLFNYKKNNSYEQINKQDTILRSLVKNVQLLYNSQVDMKIIFENQSNQKLTSIIKLADHNYKTKLLKEKTLSIIIHQSEKYILYRHLSNISHAISKTIKKPDHISTQATQKHQHQKNNKNQQKSKCPIIFYKKVFLIYKLLLKQPQKYQQIQTKLKNLQPKLIHFYQNKGSQLLTNIIAEQDRQIQNKKSLVKSTKMHKSFHFTTHQGQIKDLLTIKTDPIINAQNYFQKLINFLQIQILINRKQTFSLSFGEYGGKRRSGNQMNKDKVKFQKSCFKKRLQSLLPVIKKQVKSEQLISYNLAQSQSSKINQNTLLWTRTSQYKFLTCQQLIILILHKLLLYECEEQYINYFYDLQEILSIVDRQIEHFDCILKIQNQIQSRYAHQQFKQKYRFLSCINKQQLTMQTLRLHMRKIEIHFRLKKQGKTIVSDTKTEKNIERLIDLKSFEHIKTCYNILKSSYNDKASLYFKNQKVNKFLKNSQICQKYIDSVCQNDKVTQQFTTSIGQVDNDYKQMFAYLCERAWKKMLFNQSNNIIFFKSRVILFQNKANTYVRKRNVTMKYVKKMLNDIKINITFLHLTKNNFNYIQIDKKQNPNCKIKYLVFTVDCIQMQNNEFYLIFEQQNNITHDMVKLQAFIDMMSMVNVQFIIVMGKKAILLAQSMSRSLKSSPIIIGLQNANEQFGLDNFVQYIQHSESTIIDEKDQFLTNSYKQQESNMTNSMKKPNKQSKFIKQIYKYLDIQCFHTLLDMIICTLITNFVQITQQRTKSNRQSYNNEHHQSHVQCSYNKIKDIVIKSINLAKQIMRTKWESAKQIDIKYQIYPFNIDIDSISVLKKNFSLVPITQSIQMPLTNKFSIKQQSQQIIKYFPHFQKGSIVDNTAKLYESPLNLQDQEYYENVNRHQQLYSIMSFIQCEGRRVVSIYGANGSGKSSFLRQICWINQTYRLFKDGVYMFDAKTLLSSLQTLMGHIQIFYKQHKLFSILQESYTMQKYDSFTILLALDNLDVEFIRQNHDFFQKIKEKPICLIYSTINFDIQNQLKLQLHLDKVKIDTLKKKPCDSHQSINSHSIHSYSTRSLSSHHSNYHSLSHQFQKKKSQQSTHSSSQFHEQVWNFLKIDINSLSKHALFSIALSYLKKQQLSTLKVGMKQFISKNFSIFLANLFKQVIKQQKIYISKSQSVVEGKQLQYGQAVSQRLIERRSAYQQTQKLTLLNRTQSAVTGNSVKSTSNESQIKKLMRSLDDYFKNLSQQKVNIQSQEISLLQRSEGIQKMSLIGNLGKNILLQRKDTRLWFYQDCFEQLMIMNNTYDRMQVIFQ